MRYGDKAFRLYHLLVGALDNHCVWNQITFRRYGVLYPVERDVNVGQQSHDVAAGQFFRKTGLGTARDTSYVRKFVLKVIPVEVEHLYVGRSGVDQGFKWQL